MRLRCGTEAPKHHRARGLATCDRHQDNAIGRIPPGARRTIRSRTPPRNRSSKGSYARRKRAHTARKPTSGAVPNGIGRSLRGFLPRGACSREPKSAALGDPRSECTVRHATTLLRCDARCRSRGHQANLAHRESGVATGPSPSWVDEAAAFRVATAGADDHGPCRGSDVSNVVFSDLRRSGGRQSPRHATPRVRVWRGGAMLLSE